MLSQVPVEVELDAVLEGSYRSLHGRESLVNKRLAAACNIYFNFWEKYRFQSYIGENSALVFSLLNDVLFTLNAFRVDETFKKSLDLISPKNGIEGSALNSHSSLDESKKLLTRLSLDYDEYYEICEVVKSLLKDQKSKNDMKGRVTNGLNNLVLELDIAIKNFGKASVVPPSNISFPCSEIERKMVSGGYRVDFKPSPNAFVKNLIEKICKLTTDNNISTKFDGAAMSFVYSPIVHLTNSSGSGKTRAAMELGKFTNVIFVKFGNDNGVNASEFGKRLIYFLSETCKDRHIVELYVFMDVLIHRMIYACRIYCESHNVTEFINIDLAVNFFESKVPMNIFEGLNVIDPIALEAMIVELVNDPQFLLERHRVTMPTWNAIDFDVIVKKNEEWLINRREMLPGFVQYCKSKSVAELPKLVLVIDEAHTLIVDESIDPESKSKCRVRDNIRQDRGETESVPEFGDVGGGESILNDDLKNLQLDEKSENDVSGQKAAQADINVLLPKKSDGIYRFTDVYHIIRGTLRHSLFYWNNCLTISISTVAKYSKFYPLSEHDPSFRRRELSSRELLPPIVLSGTFDAFIKGRFSSKSTKNWMKFLFSGARAMYIALCGRPLWAIVYGTKVSTVLEHHFGHTRYFDMDVRDMAKMDLVPFMFHSNLELNVALMKMGKNVDAKLKKELYENVVLGIATDEESFSSVLGLSVGLSKFPEKIDMTELVRVGGYNLLEISPENHGIVGHFCSEGIFNGLASALLAHNLDAFMNTMLRWFEKNIPCFVSIGEVGELLSRILMIHAIAHSRRDGYKSNVRQYTRMRNVDFLDERLITLKLYSEIIYQPVALEDFLNAFVGVQVTKEYFFKFPVLKGSFVGFNHFTMMGHHSVEMDPYSAMANYLSRGAAMITKPRTKSVDMMIPLVLREENRKTGFVSNISFVFVQVKFGNSYTKTPTPSEVGKVSPHVVFKQHMGEGENATPYCFIYQHICAKREDSKVILWTENRAKNPAYHYPCIAACGYEPRWPSFDDLIQHLLRYSMEPWLLSHPILSNTWTVPTHRSASKMSGPNIMDLSVVKSDTAKLINEEVSRIVATNQAAPASQPQL
jgi:hypothetical protein